MKTAPTPPFFRRFFLVVFAAIGLLLLTYYLLTQIEKPEYLIFYAPIIGLFFTGTYFMMTRVLGLHMHIDRFPDSHPEMEF